MLNFKNQQFSALLIFSILFLSIDGIQGKPIRLGKRQSKYPPILQPADPSYLPQDWKDALTAAQNAGKIPNIPQSTASPAGVTYPNNIGNSPDTCSWTVTKCNGPNDISQAPDGVWVVAFDDGPTNVSPDLYNFLQSQNQSATHFLIGSNIVQNEAAVKQAASQNQELAVHTWSHNEMSTLSNEVILGELGWTMQIIYDLTGKVPTTWRPPQGDIDNRVRAIAEEVFGLTAVMWDAECNDWCLNGNGGSSCPGMVPGKDYGSVVQAVQQAIQRPKSPGVILLEHELTTDSVGIFKNAYPQIKSAGWNTTAVSDAVNKDWYTNAENGTDEATPVKGMVINENEPSTSSSSTSSSTTTSSSATVSAGATTTTTKGPFSSSTTSKQNGPHTSGAMQSSVLPSVLITTLLASFVGFHYLI